MLLNSVVVWLYTAVRVLNIITSLKENRNRALYTEIYYFEGYLRSLFH